MGRKNKKRAAKKRAAEQKQTAAASPAEESTSHDNYRGGLFDTRCSVLDCLHGSLPPTSLRRQEAASMIAKYFDERFSPELKKLPLPYINYRFFVHNRDSVGVDMAALVLHDAANHALLKSFKLAHLLVHLHVWLDKWLRACKPQVPFCFEGNDEVEGQKSPIWNEIQLATNGIETPWEICNYIDKHLPCDCLKEIKKAAKNEVSHTKCDGCNKEGTHRDFMSCSACKGASYCSRECQVAHWGDHRGLCRSVQGKKVSVKDSQKLAGDLLTLSSREIQTAVHSMMFGWTTSD